MKKVLYVTGLLLLSVALVGCSSQKKAGSNRKQIESSQNTTEGFNKLMDDYVAKQQSLMMKQAEGESGELEAVLKHTQDVVASDEYKEWIDVSEKIESYELPNKTTEDKQFRNAQAAIVAYNKVQKEYFTRLAKATSTDDYNNIIDELLPSLEEVQDKLEKVVTTFE